MWSIRLPILHHVLVVHVATSTTWWRSRCFWPLSRFCPQRRNVDQQYDGLVPTLNKTSLHEGKLLIDMKSTNLGPGEFRLLEAIEDRNHQYQSAPRVKDCPHKSWGMAMLYFFDPSYNLLGGQSSVIYIEPAVQYAFKCYSSFVAAHWCMPCHQVSDLHDPWFRTDVTKSAQSRTSAPTQTQAESHNYS